MEDRGKKQAARKDGIGKADKKRPAGQISSGTPGKRRAADEHSSQPKKKSKPEAAKHPASKSKTTPPKTPTTPTKRRGPDKSPPKLPKGMKHCPSCKLPAVLEAGCAKVTCWSCKYRYVTSSRSCGGRWV